ncbi:MAG: TonB-dependent receptor [FCB group bacterium]|nr:TonB-dependent receptor [FCB group bacterium]
MRNLACNLLLLILVLPLRAYNVSGYIIDGETGESIIGVNVFIGELGIGDATNLDGFFILRNVQPGNYTLTVSHIAYGLEKQKISVGRKDLFLGNLTLTPAPLSTQAVEVTGVKNSIIHKETDIASFQVDPTVLTDVPQLNKDVFALLKYSPSVTVADPYSPQYFVRGSDPGENLVQLDGMTIYNPQHFLGSYAIFNPYAIKNIEMLMGGFDAEYGGRNASILNIATREGNHREIHGEFRPSISGLTGAIEFPVNRQTTAMISGRFLSDLMLRVIMGSPNVMMDFNSTLQTKIGRTRLRFSGFYARDYMDYSVDNIFLFLPQDLFDEFREGFITNTNNLALGISTNTLLRPNLLLETQLYHSRSQVDNHTYFGYTTTDTTSALDIVFNFNTRIENAIADNTVKANLKWYAFKHQTFKFGFELNDLGFSHELGRTVEKRNPYRYDTEFQAVFIQDEVALGNLLIKLGLRNSRSKRQATWQQEPRLSASLRLGNSTLKAAYGHYYQYLTSMDSRNDEMVQFLDYYSAIDQQEPINSVHYILGLEGQLNPRLDYSLSTYYKVLNRIYRSTYSNNRLAEAGGQLIEQGEGEAYGVEALVRGEVGRLSGWISYTWSRGLRRYPSIMNGKTVIFDGDQPHNLKAVLMFKLTPDITASSTFRFTSGFPRTWETGQLMHYQYDPLNHSLGAFATSITPERNNVRYPPRLTWDIGWKKKLRSGFGFYLAEYLGGLDAFFNMTLRNLLFLHRDPTYYFYFPNYGYYGYDFEFIPSVSVGYSIRF